MKKLLYHDKYGHAPLGLRCISRLRGRCRSRLAYGMAISPSANRRRSVEKAIFTRGLKDKKNTAIFIGGGNMSEGEAVLAAVLKKFFAKFRVSVACSIAMFPIRRRRPRWPGWRTAAPLPANWRHRYRRLEDRSVSAAVLLARDGADDHHRPQSRCRGQPACESIHAPLRHRRRVATRRRPMPSAAPPSRARRSCSPRGPPALHCSMRTNGRTAARWN